MIKKKLFVSNLCWKKKDTSFVVDCLKKEKISGIDFAPLNYFTTWNNILNNSRKLSIIFRKKKIKINALQGIFFKKNLNLFKFNNKKKIIDHFKIVIKLCKIFGAKKIILGSADFRDPKKISKAKADRNFVIFFKHLNKFLRKNSIYLCIEPIPMKYGENYLYNISHLNYLISKINSPNIKINFDTSIYHFKKFEKLEFLDNLNNIKNIQISQPNFKYFENPTKKNLKFLKILKQNKKIKNISLEMIDNQLKKFKFIKSLKNFRTNLSN